VPKELDELALKAVAPNPDSRYQSVATFAAELRSMAAVLDVRGGAGDEEEQLAGESTSVSRVMLTAAVMLVLLAAIAWWFTRS
jgi:hypothetical protein